MRFVSGFDTPSRKFRDCSRRAICEEACSDKQTVRTNSRNPHISKRDAYLGHSGDAPKRYQQRTLFDFKKSQREVVPTGKWPK